MISKTASGFQFQLGTIGSIRLFIKFETEKLFQFQLGTIGRSLTYRKRAISTVSIPAWYDWESFWQKRVIRTFKCFNSSLVRLGVWKKCAYSSILIVSIPAWYDWELWIRSVKSVVKMFQFQLGTIGRQGQPRRLTTLPEFQFQLGTIGRELSQVIFKPVPRFQFQLGTIGSYERIANKVTSICFNSSLVRLGDLQGY